MSFFWQHCLLLDSNVKKENIGKSKREGCLRKVLRRLWCQVKMVPVIRPGTLKEQRTIKNVTDVPFKLEEIVLAQSVEMQERKMMMNLMERYPPRSPPSATTLQTPTFEVKIRISITADFYLEDFGHAQACRDP